MLNIYLPQPIYAPHAYERLISADLFIKESHLHLFPAYYPDFKAHFSKLEIRHMGNTLKGEAIWQPDVIAYQYNISTDTTPPLLDIQLTGNYTGTFRAQQAPRLSKVFLTAATLFKDDYTQLEAWVDYHAAQGFERFVLYYNGCISTILPDLLKSKSLNTRDIVLIQWPYSYWVEGAPLGNEGLLARHGDDTDISQVRPDYHHAQHLMLNHVLLLLSGTTEYVGLFDLDEYFKARPGLRITELIKSYQNDIYIFQSRWAELRSKRVPGWGDHQFFFASEEMDAAADWEPYPHRSKYIGRLEALKSLGVHSPRTISDGARAALVPPELAGIYHFHCFSGKASRRDFVNPSKQWVPITEFQN